MEPLSNYLTHIDEQTIQRMSGSVPIERMAAQQRELMIHIQFFQHERLVHLLVTLTIALFFVGLTLFLVSSPPSLGLFTVDLLFLGLLIPYLVHYFKLENGVQKLYRIYDSWSRNSE